MLTQEGFKNESKKNEQQEIFFTKINRLFEMSFADPTTSISNLSSQLAMSERQLFRKMKSHLGMTPADYLRRFRLEKSRKLLARNKSVTYTAFEVGFSTQSSFTKCFTAHYGLSPKNYKKLLSRETEVPIICRSSNLD